MELLGRLLVEELAELKVVKFMSTLCGLCLIFWKAVLVRLRDFGGLSEVGGRVGVSSVGMADRLDEERGLPVFFDSPACCPSFSESLWMFRIGDGDLDEFIHDFFANVANDSDTVFVLLSRIALEIEGTGGASLGVVVTDPEESCLSGEPFTLEIHDLGRATRDFLLPTRSSFGRSSFDSLLPVFPSRPFTVCGSFGASFDRSADTILCAPFSDLYWPSSAGRLLKLADRGSSSSCLAVGRL
jgi:hypothetical protein